MNKMEYYKSRKPTETTVAEINMKLRRKLNWKMMCKHHRLGIYYLHNHIYVYGNDFFSHDLQTKPISFKNIPWLRCFTRNVIGLKIFLSFPLHLHLIENKGFMISTSCIHFDELL